MPIPVESETLLLNDAKAISLAAPFGRFDENGEYDEKKTPADDPFDEEIDPSLLNAGDIKKYVMETGLISPFYDGGGSKSRLKDASYEGRIGKSAYVFKAGENTPTQIFEEGDRVLKVPANSIVFVESDLYFRIPDFIALRFNLQIKHVHRGLLLGTGPLVDPGYWGRLCIPLHNLTDEDYYIPADEGLIWIEFTKTTVITDRIGRPPLGKEFPEILPFLIKASSSHERPSEKVGIRSSISGVITDAANRAGKAETAAKKAQRTVAGLGVAGAIAAAFGLIGIMYSSISVMRSFQSDVSILKSEFEQHISLLDGAGEVEAQATISRLSDIAESLTASVSELTSELETERSHRLQLETTIDDLIRSEQSNTDRVEKLLRYCSSVADEVKPEFCDTLVK